MEKLVPIKILSHLCSKMTATLTAIVQEVLGTHDLLFNTLTARNAYFKEGLAITRR